MNDTETPEIAPQDDTGEYLRRMAGIFSSADLGEQVAFKRIKEHLKRQNEALEIVESLAIAWLLADTIKIEPLPSGTKGNEGYVHGLKYVASLQEKLEKFLPK